MNKSMDKVVSNSIILIFTRMFQRTIRIVLVIFSARILGVDNYGKFAFALAFTILFLIIADMGLHQLFIREVARDKKNIKKYVGNSLIIKMFLSIINLSLIFFIINLTNKPLEIKIAVYIIALYQILTSYNQFFKAVFHAFQEMRYDGITSLLQTLLETGLGISVLLLGGNFQSLACMFLISSLLTLCWSVFITLKNFTAISFNIDIKLIRFLIRESLPFGINYFFSTMYTYVDSVMLSLIISDHAVGIYNSAYRLIFASLFIGEGIIRAIYPALSKYYKESIEKFKDLFEKSIKIMFYLGFSLAALISFLSRKIIIFFYGLKYIAAADVIRILVWTVPLIYITNVMTHTVCSADRQRVTARVIAFAAFLNLGLNFLLIPRFSYIGAAYATLATEGFVFLFHLIYLYVKLVKPPIAKFALKIITVNTIMLFSAYLMGSVHVVLTCFIAVIINILMAVMVRLYSKEEILLIMNLLRFRKQ